ncbi:dicarboxylate/amino acid:cation symporter [Cardinium endosymbiont of Tipula unca]|uniref:dicarboxylate/amino acid:cation symporter n=1 Tax=Cardinium endosymbiont of Tipula unca TaxID=3066216 RepID=UPI0030CA706C
MKKNTLHLQILGGMFLGCIFALISVKLALPTSFAVNYLKPIGTIFFNSLKMVAIPLVFASLIVSIASIQDTTKISRIGRKAFLMYASTTLISAIIGIGITNLVKPGSFISTQTRASLLALYGHTVTQLEVHNHPKLVENGPLHFFTTLIPENFFNALTNNLNLLQVVVTSVLLGIALLKVPHKKRQPVLMFFDGIYEAITALIRMIMQLAPVGVFALIASLLIELADHQSGVGVSEVLYALLGYVATVIGGLLVIVLLLYPMILRVFTNIRFIAFLKGIYPAQLVAFSSSSSSAALPVLMESVEKNLDVPEEISSFVLPLGVTVNMNGTALYQAVICVFVAQAMGIELSLTTQCVIVGNVALSSIGVAGVPGSALVMTMVLLQSVGIPAAGLALVLAPDRLLDMCRTVVNITGDGLAAVVIAQKEVKNC